MNGLLLALHAFTLTRREMLIILRYRYKHFWGRHLIRKQYGDDEIDRLLTKYKDYRDQQLVAYIAKDNENIRSIVRHISIEELLTHINR